MQKVATRRNGTAFAGLKCIAAGIILVSPMLLAAPASAKPVSGTGTIDTPVSQPAAPIDDFTGVTVVHWGPGFQSAPLDASVPENRDPKKVVPESVRKAGAARAGISPTAVGFLCSLYVGKTSKNSSGSKLQATTGQTCTGAFSEQFTVDKFERKTWLQYWTGFSTEAESSHVSSQTLDRTWSVTCSGSGLDYNYRLIARAYARSSEDGNLVHGQLIYGDQSSPYKCGT